MTFQPVDRPPYCYFWGPWRATLARWHREGLEQDKAVGQELIERFGIDPEDRGTVTSRWPDVVNNLYCPLFDVVVVEEDESRRIVRDWDGAVRLQPKAVTQFTHVLEYPCKDRGDWERIRDQRLDPASPERFAGRWRQTIDRRLAEDKVIRVGASGNAGIYGLPRRMFGDERLMLLFHDDPALVHEIMEYLTEFWLTIYGRVAEVVQIDVFFLWEDMAYRGGPLIGPEMFERFMAPCYRRVQQFCGRRDIPIISVDSDGNVERLAEWMHAVGVNELWPMEVQAGNDVIEFRKRLPRLAMFGGFDKRILAGGRAAIKAELERLVPLSLAGGYIITPDHGIPDDVSWPNFLYYYEELGRMLGAF